MISDILEVASTLALEGFLVTVDIEKAFDFVNHCFLLQILQKFGFGKDFVSWIKTVKNLASLTVEKQNISNKKEVLDKEIRYLRICLYLFKKYFLHL